MPRLVIATSAVDAPMGAQAYQEEIAGRAAAALGATGETWSVRRSIARSLRSPLPGTVRLPMGRLTTASPAARRALGRLAYPRRAVVHRMNLELPPAPGMDVITLHDVVAWRFADESAPVRAAAEEARRAAAVVCVSRFTASEAMDLLGISEPHVVHNGVAQRFFDAEPADRATLVHLGIDQPFVLHAGGAAARKNLDGLAQAWSMIARARPDLTLVMSGPPHPRRTALFAGLPRVRLVGRQPDAVLTGLIAAAAVVVVPSLYEGFGLPALEGMAAGVPVVAARTSSLPEVVGDCGVLVEPTADEIAHGVLWAASDDPEIAVMVDRGRVRAREFTWERSAAGHAAVWASVAGP